MPDANRSGFQDGFMEIVQEQLEISRQEVREIDEKLANLQRERAAAAKRVSQLEDLLGEHQLPSRSKGVEFNPLPAQMPSSLRAIADADAVVELIREHGQAMHYLDIHKRLIERGFEIGGRGQADTLLSRYFDDERLVRVARGTYDLADRQAATTSGTQHVDEAVKVQPKPTTLRPIRFEIPLPPAKLAPSMNLGQMAAEVLRQAGRPLHYKKITKQIIDAKAWEPITETPEASVNSAMVIDIQKNGTNSLFIRTDRGVYGLRERDSAE